MSQPTDKAREEQSQVGRSCCEEDPGHSMANITPTTTTTQWTCFLGKTQACIPLIHAGCPPHDHHSNGDGDGDGDGGRDDDHDDDDDDAQSHGHQCAAHKHGH